MAKRKSTAVRRHPGHLADEFNSLPIAPAARFLGVSRQTLYNWLAEGRVKAQRIGARQRILRTDMERLARRRRP